MPVFTARSTDTGTDSNNSYGKLITMRNKETGDVAEKNGNTKNHGVRVSLAKSSMWRSLFVIKPLIHRSFITSLEPSDGIYWHFLKLRSTASTPWTNTMV